MTKRLLHRGQTSGRVDDNEETIKNRLKTFHNQTMPVLDLYEKQGKLAEVSQDDLAMNSHRHSPLCRWTRKWHRMMYSKKCVVLWINSPKTMNGSRFAFTITNNNNSRPFLMPPSTNRGSRLCVCVSVCLPRCEDSRLLKWYRSVFVLFFYLIFIFSTDLFLISPHFLLTVVYHWTMATGSLQARARFCFHST